MRLDTAMIKRIRVRQEMETKRYKSLNWIGLDNGYQYCMLTLHAETFSVNTQKAFYAQETLKN